MNADMEANLGINAYYIDDLAADWLAYSQRSLRQLWTGDGLTNPRSSNSNKVVGRI